MIKCGKILDDPVCPGIRTEGTRKQFQILGRESRDLRLLGMVKPWVGGSSPGDLKRRFQLGVGVWPRSTCN